MMCRRTPPVRVRVPAASSESPPGDVQLPQQLDLPQGLHVRLAVVPVAVVRPTGGEKPLLFIEADVSLCDADQLLDLVDLHCVSPLTALPYTSTGWKVKKNLSETVVYTGGREITTLRPDERTGYRQILSRFWATVGAAWWSPQCPCAGEILSGRDKPRPYVPAPFPGFLTYRPVRGGVTA